RGEQVRREQVLQDIDVLDGGAGGAARAGEAVQEAERVVRIGGHEAERVRHVPGRAGGLHREEVPGSRRGLEALGAHLCGCAAGRAEEGEHGGDAGRTAVMAWDTRQQRNAPGTPPWGNGSPGIWTQAGGIHDLEDLRSRLFTSTRPPLPCGAAAMWRSHVAQSCGAVMWRGA